MNTPIGIFDSGVGGLTVAKAIKQLLPNEQIIYYGDTLHLPYGEKSPETIQKYSKNIANFLIQQNCKAIVIACNSASAYAFESLKQELPINFPLFNVIDPMVNYVKQKHKNNLLGVIGTKATIRSQVYKNRLGALPSTSLETPLLASMIEEGFVNNDVSHAVIKNYLSKNDLSGIKALVLGCTHYPLLKNEIESFYDGKVQVLDSSEIVAKSVSKELEQNGLLAETKANNDDHFFVSDYTPFFEKITASFFGSKINLKELKIT